MANGRCRLHGGKNTGPKDPTKLIGNKNGVKTGLREAIWFDALDDEEARMIHEIDLSPIKQVQNELLILEIRERRMLHRIAALRDGKKMLMTKKKTKRGIEKGYEVNYKEIDKETAETMIVRLEEALNRVQATKAKLISQLYEMEKDKGPSNPDISAYIAALNATAEDVWEDEEDEDDGSDE